MKYLFEYRGKLICKMFTSKLNIIEKCIYFLIKRYLDIYERIKYRHCFKRIKAINRILDEINNELINYDNRRQL